MIYIILTVGYIVLDTMFNTDKIQLYIFIREVLFSSLFGLTKVSFIPSHFLENCCYFDRKYISTCYFVERT